MYRSERQRRVARWCADAFGVEHATNLAQRALRFREEAEELYQAAMAQAGFDPVAALAMAHKQTDHVHGRPVGEVGQELGGVGVTVLALAACASLDADDCERDEVLRVLDKPLAHFTARNAAKNAAGFDVTGHAYPTAARDSAAAADTVAHDARNFVDEYPVERGVGARHGRRWAGIAAQIATPRALAECDALASINGRLA